MRDSTFLIKDILESIENIENFSKGLTKEKFSKNKLKQSAIIRQLEIIGEAVKNLPIGFTNEYPEIPWKDIAGFRDLVIHSYFRVDLEKVWNIIKENLPDLKEKILKVKNGLESRNRKS